MPAELQVSRLGAKILVWKPWRFAGLHAERSPESAAWLLPRRQRRPLKSIRRELLVGLLGAVIVAGGFAAVGVYFQAREQAGALFDYQLRQMALSLRDQSFQGLASIDAAPYAEDFDFSIEIRSHDGAQLYYSRSRVTLPAVTARGYSTVDTHDGPWRLYTLQQGGFTVRVGQPMHVRNALAAQAALRTLTPFLLLVPLLALLVWLAVTHGLKSLEAVAGAVKTRSPASLHPLPNADAPQEVKPVVDALNDLLDRLSRALELQRAFVADAAHELRTPLTALRLQTQLAERATDPAERAAAFDTLENGIERATRLVEQLLALARSEPSAAELPAGDVDLGALAREVVVAYADLAAAKGVDLGLGRTQDGLVVRGDAEGLRTLLSNLVDNAMRYTPAGGHVDVSAQRDTQRIVLVVTDTGPGIPAHERERVFDRFYRRAGSDQPGSGLGLAIVRSIAERHGARVQLDSGADGRGLVARVVFPA